MIEVPLNWVLINPLFDIFIFIGISYIFIFKFYKKLLDKDFRKISWIDLELTVIFVSLAYLNYSETKISFLGKEFDWLFIVVIIQLFVEGVFIFLYWKDVKIYLKKIKKSNKEIREEQYIKKISELKAIKSLMEQDFNKYKSQGNEKSLGKISEEIEKIDEEILNSQKELNFLKENKNDRKK